MNLFPLENITWPYLKRMDNFIHRHHFLYESRIFGIISTAGFVISLPFYELALTIEHFALALLNEMHHFKNYNDEHRWARGIHTKNIVQHIFGATLMPLVFAVKLIKNSLSLLHPYIYYLSRPNQNIFKSNWQESQLWSKEFCYDTIKILKRPEVTVNRIESLIAEILPKVNVNEWCIYKDGVFIENHHEIADRYLIQDQQHHKIWLLNKDEVDATWKITELVRTFSPYNPFETVSNPIILPNFNSLLDLFSSDA